MNATPASEWKTANRKEITLPSGRTVILRKLTGEFILVAREVAEMSLAAAGSTTPVRLTVSQYRRYIQAQVIESVYMPRVVPEAQAAGEDEMHARDFGPDLDALVQAIHEFNQELLVLPFRSVADGAATAPDGGGLRGAPEPAPAGEPAGSTD